VQAAIPGSTTGLFSRYQRRDQLNYRFFICDVFTEVRFGGNQLAVFPDARGLSDSQMQQIAREINFSETTFVLPAEKGHTRRVRIFTPMIEVPFAGHPSIGTVFVLATTGELGTGGLPRSVILEQAAGTVPVSIQKTSGDTLWCELKAPETLSLGRTADIETLSIAVSLSVDDFDTSVHVPRVASVGLPFLFARVRDAETLSRARVNPAGFDQLRDSGLVSEVHLYAMSSGTFDIQARVFVPSDGLFEDPATGSANCALGALLAQHNTAAHGKFAWTVSQGSEIGRPSTIHLRASKEKGSVTGSWVGGHCVMVSDATFYTA